MANNSNSPDSMKTPNEQAIGYLNRDIRNINSAIKQDQKILKDLEAISQEKAGLELQIPQDISADITAGKAKLEERYKALDATLIPEANTLLNDYVHEKHFDGVQISEIMIADARRRLDALIEEREKIDYYLAVVAKIEETNRKINDIESLGIRGEIETLNDIKARHEQEILLRQNIIEIDNHLAQNAQILKDRGAIEAQKSLLELQIPQEVSADIAEGKKMLRERYAELDKTLIPQANSLLHDYTHEKYTDGVQISEIMIADARRRMDALVEERGKIDAYLAIVAKIEECNRKLADMDSLGLAKENEKLILARQMLFEEIDALRFLAIQNRVDGEQAELSGLPQGIGVPRERAIVPANGGALGAGAPTHTGTGEHGEQEHNGQRHAEPDPAAPRAGLDRKAIIDEYVKLLRAKEKLFRGRKSQGILERASEIRNNFKGLVNQELANSADKPDAIKKIYGEITAGLAGTKRPVEKFLRFMRKPKVAIVRTAIGVGLAGGAAVIGGVVAIPMLAAAGIIGAAGRFVGTTGAFDVFHTKVTGRKGRNENGIGVQVMHNNQKAIDDRVATVFSSTEDAADRMDNGMYVAARKYRSYKVWKALAATALAVVPLAGSIMDKFHLFGHGGHAVTAPGTPATTIVAPTVAPGETFVVPNGGGIWHIAKEALAQRGIHDVYSIDRLKDMIVADPGKFGLVQNEIIPRAISNGGPWLNLVADAVIPKSALDLIAGDAEKLSMARKAAQAAAKGAVHVAKAKMAV